MVLSSLIVLPLLGALPLLLARDKNAREIKVWAFLISLVNFIVSLQLWSYDPSSEAYQFTEHHSWINLAGSLNVNYDVGVDGVSSLLILLTTFITPIAILGAWNY